MGRIAVFALVACAAFGQATVPFVGCKSDGQVGPMDAPTGKDPVLPISAEAARRLAYYSAGELGVLAPRGWNCFRTYGSAGEIIFVGPQQVNTATLFSAGWNGEAGPAVEIAATDGGTSGRFEVADVIARVFPAHGAFVGEVVRSAPTTRFPVGPDSADKLTYNSSEVVEYETPAQTDGLGTRNWLKKNPDPIRGTAILTGDTPDLLRLSVRLPPDLGGLTDIIIRQVERDAQKEVK